jgi:hypothetical protein
MSCGQTGSYRHISRRGQDMAQGISEILTFAIGVAISPVPIIAVI